MTAGDAPDAALVDAAEREVIAARFASRPMLQWHFGLSANDAERVLAALEARGVVGPPGPGVHRDVLTPTAAPEVEPDPEFWSQDNEADLAKANEWWADLPSAEVEVPGLAEPGPPPGVNRAALVTVPPLLPPDEPWRVPPGRSRRPRARTAVLAVGGTAVVAACGVAAWAGLGGGPDSSAAPDPGRVTVTATVTVPAPQTTPVPRPTPSSPSASPSSASPSPDDQPDVKPASPKPRAQRPRPAYTPPRTRRPQQPSSNRGWCPIRDSNGRVIGYVKCPG